MTFVPWVTTVRVRLFTNLSVLMVSFRTRQVWLSAQHARLDSFVIMWRARNPLHALKIQIAIWVSRDNLFVRWACTTTLLMD